MGVRDYFSAKFTADIVYEAISNIGSRGPAYKQLLAEGTKVAALYRNTYYPAVITRVNENGTYDVKFERSPPQVRRRPHLQSGMKRQFIVRIEHQPGKHVLAERAKVLVTRTQGDRTHYDPVLIECMNSDGTYDVTYNSGRGVKKESRVDRNLIRERGPPMLNELRDHAHVHLASVATETRKPFIAQATKAVEEREWTVASAAASNGLNCVPDHWEDSKPVELVDLKKRAVDALKAIQEENDRQRGEALLAERQVL